MKFGNYKTQTVIIFLSLIMLNPIVFGLHITQSLTNPPALNLNCTNFAASFGDTMIFGNSEDGGIGHPLSKDPESTCVFYFQTEVDWPPIDDGYACVFVGWMEDGRISAQGGMNDQGLCYDLTSVPDAPMTSHPEHTYSVDGNWIQLDVLRENANVSEVISFLENVNWEGPVWFQWFFADSMGDIVIVSPGTDGELVFTRKAAGIDGFLTQTNFNRANNKSGTYPCWRYDASYAILNEITQESELTVSKMTTVLDAVHFKKGITMTGYSNLFDPNEQMLYLNILGQFTETATINVTEELLIDEYRAVPMADYFSEDTVASGMAYYQSYRNRLITYATLAITGVVLILGGIFFGIYLIIRKKRRLKMNN